MRWSVLLLGTTARTIWGFDISYTTNTFAVGNDAASAQSCIISDSCIETYYYSRSIPDEVLQNMREEIRYNERESCEITFDSTVSDATHLYVSYKNILNQPDNNLKIEIFGTTYVTPESLPRTLNAADGLITKANFEVAFDIAGGGNLYDENNLGVVRVFTVQAANGTAATNGWDYEQVFENGDPSVYWFFRGQSQEGAVGVGSNPATAGYDHASYDIGTLFYNDGTKSFRDATAGGSSSDSGVNIGRVWTINSGAANINIPRVIMKWYGPRYLSSASDYVQFKVCTEVSIDTICSPFDFGENVQPNEITQKFRQFTTFANDEVLGCIEPIGSDSHLYETSTTDLEFDIATDTKATIEFFGVHPFDTLFIDQCALKDVADSCTINGVTSTSPFEIDTNTAVTITWNHDSYKNVMFKFQELLYDTESGYNFNDHDAYVDTHSACDNSYFSMAYVYDTEDECEGVLEAAKISKYTKIEWNKEYEFANTTITFPDSLNSTNAAVYYYDYFLRCMRTDYSNKYVIVIKEEEASSYDLFYGKERVITICRHTTTNVEESHDLNGWRICGECPRNILPTPTPTHQPSHVPSDVPTSVPTLISPAPSSLPSKSPTPRPTFSPARLSPPSPYPTVSCESEFETNPHMYLVGQEQKTDYQKTILGAIARFGQENGQPFPIFGIGYKSESKYIIPSFLNFAVTIDKSGQTATDAIPKQQTAFANSVTAYPSGTTEIMLTNMVGTIHVGMIVKPDTSANPSLAAHTRVTKHVAGSTTVTISPPTTGEIANGDTLFFNAPEITVPLWLANLYGDQAAITTEAFMSMDSDNAVFQDLGFKLTLPGNQPHSLQITDGGSALTYTRGTGNNIKYNDFPGDWRSAITVTKTEDNGLCDSILVLPYLGEDYVPKIECGDVEEGSISYPDTLSINTEAYAFCTTDEILHPECLDTDARHATGWLYKTFSGFKILNYTGAMGDYIVVGPHTGTDGTVCNITKPTDKTAKLAIINKTIAIYPRALPKMMLIRN